MYDHWDQDRRWMRGAQMVGVLILAGVLAFIGLVTYGIYQHYAQDHANAHAVVQLLQYNLQVGKILPLAAPPVAPPVAPEAPKKP